MVHGSDYIEWSREAAYAPDRWAKSLASNRPPAQLKDVPEDFVVHEIPDGAFSGSGEHLLVLFEKTMLSTPDLVSIVQQSLGVHPNEIGYAGKKDKRAKTSQWLSLPQRFAAQLSAINHPEVRILDVTRHTSKLRIGHLWGNLFAVTVRGAFRISAQSSVSEVWSRLIEHGMPNFYGPQRFGERLDNAEAGLRFLLEGPKRGRLPRHRQFLVSAAQSAVFNHVLLDRWAADPHLLPQEGDLCMPTHRAVATMQGSNDRFVPIISGESVPTGIIFGGRAELRSGRQFELERSRLDEVNLSRELIKAWGREIPGSRRPLKVVPQLCSLDWGADKQSCTLNFALPSGSYATVLANTLFDLGSSLMRES